MWLSFLLPAPKAVGREELEPHWNQPCCFSPGVTELVASAQVQAVATGPAGPWWKVLPCPQQVIEGLILQVFGNWGNSPKPIPFLLISLHLPPNGGWEIPALIFSFCWDPSLLFHTAFLGKGEKAFKVCLNFFPLCLWFQPKVIHLREKGLFHTPLA